MSPAIGIICIPSGQGRNFIAREIVKKNLYLAYGLLIFLRKTCNLCMILPGGRDMKSGTGAEGVIF
jgi:hypothetical protein